MRLGGQKSVAISRLAVIADARPGHRESSGGDNKRRHLCTREDILRCAIRNLGKMIKILIDMF